MASVVERVTNLEARFDAIASDLTQVREAVVRLDDKVERRFEAVDRKFEAVDRKFEAVDRKFEAVDQRFETLEHKMDAGFTEVRSDLRWILGAIAGATLSVIATILGALL